MQLEPATYNRGMIASFRQVIAKEGAGALATGFGPTATGYFIQGAFKFGGYEFFKKQTINLIGLETATQNRLAVYSVSSACAEFFASVALCPLEATRIRLVSQPSFATGLVGGFSKIAKQEGFGGFYSGFGPILFKQYVTSPIYLPQSETSSKLITRTEFPTPSPSSPRSKRFPKSSSATPTSPSSLAAPRPVSTLDLVFSPVSVPPSFLSLPTLCSLRSTRPRVRPARAP
jgi:hypothetical protein